MNTYTTTNLNEAALLVALSIGIPPLVKTDKKATGEIEISKNAQHGMAEVKKRLLKNINIDNINTLRGTARTYHYAKTLPWGDLGIRLLPNTYLLEYQNTMRGFAAEFDSLRDLFLQAYPSEVAQAQLKLGDLFDEADYPNTYTLQQKFKFAVSFEPLPLAGDFRVDVGNTAAQELKEQYTKLTEDRVRDAMRDVWERLLAPLKNLSERLDYEDVVDEGGRYIGRKNRHFKGTIVTNVLEIVDVMKACNLTGDPKMEQVRIDLRRALDGVTYDGLKNSDSLRTLTKEKIDVIIGNLPGLGW